MSGPLPTIPPGECREFIFRHSRPARPALVAELVLHLARSGRDAEEALERELHERGFPSPFWLQAWGGGQVLARYILDHPGTVQGKTVLDIGCGGGLVALAALKAGAARAIALDTDPLALQAVVVNGEWNGLFPEPRQGRLQEIDPSDVDLALFGDMCYSVELADSVCAWCLKNPHIPALIGDPGRKHRPWKNLLQVQDYRVPTARSNAGPSLQPAGVFRFVP